MKLSFYEREATQLNIVEAARQAEMTSQRFSRAVKILGIPVARSGRVVLVSRSAIDRVKKAFEQGKIRRGRPAKKEAASVS